MLYLKKTLATFWRKLTNRQDTEHAQCLIRAGIGCSIILWFYLKITSTEIDHVEHLILFGCAGLYTFFSLVNYVFLAPPYIVNKTVRYTWQVVDPLFYGAVFILGGVNALPFLFIFLCFPIDNGFRYGVKQLYISLFLFCAVFTVVLTTQDYWKGRILIGVGSLAADVLMSIYAAKLMQRIAEASEKLANLATRDALTNLPNRHLFMEHLTHAMAKTKRNARYCACIFIDLDGFKKVNDTHGHAVGDLLLVEVSKQLDHCLRDTDLVARLGGDEFAIVSDCYTVPTDAIMVSQRILAALAEIKNIAGCSIDISASIGVAWYKFEPQKTVTTDALVSSADRAMYAAKEAGKRCIRISNPDGSIDIAASFLPNKEASIPAVLLAG